MNNFSLSNASRVLRPSWYKEQMTGWNKPSYILLIAGWIFLLVTGFLGGVTELAITSTIAGVIGFTCTVAITNGKPINGILGFVSALMLIYVASVTGNYSDIIMQGFYIVILDLPIMFSFSWNKQDFKPRKMNRHDILLTGLLFLGFLAVTFTIDTLLHSPQAILDAISASIGLTGAVLTLKKFRATYYFWLGQGIMSVALWIQTAMHGHAVWVLMFTYILYLLNDLVAFTFSKWFHTGAK